MAAPTFVATAVTGAVLGVDLTCAVPTGTQNGDLMVAYGLCSSGTGINTPAGWTAHPISFGAQAPLFYRRASSEPGSYVFVTSGGGNSMIRIVTYRGVHASSPFDDADSHVGPTGNVILPATTSLGLDRLLAQFIAKAGNTTFTGPGTTTERWDAASPSSLIANAGGDEVVSSGAIGTRTWTPAAGTQSSIGYVLVLASIPPNSGTIAGSVTTSGTITGHRQPRGSFNGTASSSATIVGSRTSRGTIGGSATPSATINGSITMRGSFSGNVTSSGTIQGPATKHGAFSGSVTTSGTITGHRRPTGTIATNVSTSGVIFGRRHPRGSFSGHATSSGTIVGRVRCHGSFYGTVTSGNTFGPPRDITVLSVTEVHRTVTIGWSTPTAYGSGAYGGGAYGQIPAPRTVTVTEVPRPVRIETVP